MKTTNFIGAVLAGSIALTSAFAAPVAASGNSDRLAKILLGAAAVGLVVHTINKKKRARRAAVDRRDNYRPYPARAYHQDHYPKTCLRKRYTRHGWKTFYSQRCLAEFRHYDNDGYVYNGGYDDNYMRPYGRNAQTVNSGRYYNRNHRSEK